MTLDLDDTDPVFTDLVGEQEAVLNDAALLGGRLLVSYLVDAKVEVHRYKLDGTPDGGVKLPGIGSAGGFRGNPEEPESFFVFTSFDTPSTVYRYDVAANTREVWAAPKVDAGLDRIGVDQRFYTSKDGTRVPMFIVRRRDVTSPAPTLLYGYGGFGISMIPVWSPAWFAWVEQGGVLAVANIRGGGEYGKAWHDAGRLEKKQNVFDDFIAAGEYLKADGIPPAAGLAIQGESGGGLLVGAVVNQRPDLFAASLAGVGVMDMLRYHRFTGGQLWMADYGDPAKEADFRNLRAYSPYHNIAPGRDYPAILSTTADTDNRVVPGHTFKYIAALQAADLGPKPHLVRIETRAGHGAGKPLDKIIQEVADQWAFAAYWTGLDVEATR
ncbi:peptidase [Mycobacterium tuberculosis]|nr:peptidase [Mycobacterium tuberculosis]